MRRDSFDEGWDGFLLLDGRQGIRVLTNPLQPIMVAVADNDIPGGLVLALIEKIVSRTHKGRLW